LTGDYRHGILTLTVPCLAAAAIVLWMRRAALTKASAPAG
jgi:hypothetical protein